MEDHGTNQQPVRMSPPHKGTHILAHVVEHNLWTDMKLMVLQWLNETHLADAHS